MTEAEALRLVIRQRIRDLWAYRNWYRNNRWATWTDLRAENAVELRALVALYREARDMADSPPSLLRGWTETEKREAFGR